MIEMRAGQREREKGQRTPLLQPGTMGRLFLVSWSLAAVLLAPPDRILPAGLLALLAAAIFTPRSLRRAASGRFLLLLLLMVLPPLFLLGERDLALGPLSLSGAGLRAGAQMALRALVIVVAVDGFTAAVGIGQIAALCERAGLRGLGFALGVALNLLPILRETVTTSWHSLRMRGGLRRRPLRSLRYLLVTVVGNALGRAETIALTAEMRAYDPEQAPAEPLQGGRGERALVVLGLLLLCFLLFPG